MVHNHGLQQHDHHHLKRAAQAPVVEVVYVTAPQSFKGKPAGYVTLDPGESTKTSAAPSKVTSKATSVTPTPPKVTPTSSAEVKKPAEEKKKDDDNEEAAAKSTKATAVQTTLSTIRKPASTTSDADSELETEASNSSTTSDIVNAAGAVTSAPTSSSVSSISASPSAEAGGLSAGATGGLIGGGIALLLIALAFAGFLYRRRQQKVMQQAYGKPEDEKFGMANAAAPMGGAAAGTAAGGFNEKHFSQNSSPFASGQTTPAPQLQQGTSSNAGFGAPAVVAAAAVAPKRASVQQNRFSYQERIEQVQARRQSQNYQQQMQAAQQQQQQFQQAPAQSPFVPQQTPAESPFVPVPIVNPPRSQQQQQPRPQQQQQPRPQQQPPVAIAIPDGPQFAAMPPPVNPFAGGSAPASPAFSNATDMSSPTVVTTPGVATPGTPTGAAGPVGPILPVYRVIMEFKPSMGDELELIPGEVVRLMHEYDDGWALCSRMNGSQQGVCPRTCLSPRPVKPRPRNGTVSSQTGTPFSPVQGPGSRPGTPTGARGPQQPAQPQTPTGMKPVSKPQTPTSQYKPYTPPAGSRPSTPKTQSRPQTPTGQRSNQATPQNSPPRNVVPQSPVVPQILVSPSDEQPASPILGPVIVPAAQAVPKVPSPLAKEATVEESQ